MTANKVWEFVHPDSLYTLQLVVLKIPNGNTLIDFGNLQSMGRGSVVVEVNSNNQILFEIEFTMVVTYIELRNLTGHFLLLLISITIIQVILVKYYIYY